MGRHRKTLRATQAAPPANTRWPSYIARMANHPSKEAWMRLRRGTGNRTLHAPSFVRYHQGPIRLRPHACFGCRKSSKLPDEVVGKCPGCDGTLHPMGGASRSLNFTVFHVPNGRGHASTPIRIHLRRLHRQDSNGRTPTLNRDLPPVDRTGAACPIPGDRTASDRSGGCSHASRRTHRVAHRPHAHRRILVRGARCRAPHPCASPSPSQ